MLSSGSTSKKKKSSKRKSKTLAKNLSMEEVRKLLLLLRIPDDPNLLNEEKSF